MSQWGSLKATYLLQDQAIADIAQAKEQALTELSAAAEQYTTLATEHVLGYSLSGR